MSRKKVRMGMTPSWFFTFRVWWSTAWRAGLVNFVIGGIVYLVNELTEGEVLYTGGAGILGFLVSLWITLWALRKSLSIHGSAV